jgi:hypothetical protein
VRKALIEGGAGRCIMVIDATHVTQEWLRSFWNAGPFFFELL